MKLACITLAHRAPEQVTSLLSVLRHRQVQLYLHVDRRVRIAPFRRALEAAGVDRVTLLPRYATRWGTAEMIDATLAGVARGASDGCTYFTLISGQDYPVVAVDEIVALFEAAGSRSYLEFFDLPVPDWRFGGRERVEFYSYNVLGRRETCIPRGEDTSFLNWKGHLINSLLRARTSLKPPRRFPPYARPVAGRQWWNLSRDAAQYILSFVNEHPDYRRYHQDGLIPDELFFPSILLGTDFASEHELVNDCLRFMVWHADTYHPETLTEAHLDTIRSSGKPFARKFDTAVDSAVIRRLAAQVRR